MCLRGLDGRALGTCGCAGSESVAELAVDGLKVSHAAGTGGLPSLGLLAPVDWSMLIIALHVRAAVEHTLAGLSSRVAARGAGVLLDVEGSTTCPYSVSPYSSVLRAALISGLYSALNPTSGECLTYRNACRACASCCGACRSWRYPSLLSQSVSKFGYTIRSGRGVLIVD